jgi:ferrous iron transport protein A
MIRTLVDLTPGDESTITGIGGSGAIRQRLLDMGITRGTSVRCKRLAPLGDPIEICVKGALLAIRKAEAKFVEIGT